MATKNLELYFQHAPVASLNALKAIDTSGIVTGLIVEVVGVGFFNFQTPPVATPDNLNVIQATDLGGVWIRQTLPQLNATAGGKIDASSLGTVANSAVLVTSAGGVSDWETTLPAVAAGACTCTDPTTSGTESIDTALSNVLAAEPPLATAATNIEGGDANYLPYQTATDTTDFITAAASSVLVTDGSNLPSWATTLPAVEAGACTCTDPTTSSSASIDTALSNVLGAEPPLATAATNIEGGDANYIPYQTATDTTDFITAAASSVLVTDGSNVPSLSTTLPAVEAGACTCTDPTTSTSASIDDALSNVYSAIVPPDSYAANVTNVSLNPATGLEQGITGAEITVPPGKYLISYSSSQTFTPAVANIGMTCLSSAFLFNVTADTSIDYTSAIALMGKAVTGNEIFGGSGAITTIQTFTEETTVKVYTIANNAAEAGATFVANDTTITAVRLANTQATYTADGTIAATTTSTSPQIVTDAQLILPAGKYLLSFRTGQTLTTQVADASTAFEVTTYVYNTTAAAKVSNTDCIVFSGYAETGAEIFGGSASNTVPVTLLATSTLDVYIKLSAATAGADTSNVYSVITAVKLD